MVLDEPASALDLRNQARVLRVLQGLADEGMTIVMTTRHPDHALSLADRTMLIVDPSDIRVAATGRLLTADTLSELYGIPIETATVAVGAHAQRVIVPDYGLARAAAPIRPPERSLQ